MGKVWEHKKLFKQGRNVGSLGLSSMPLGKIKPTSNQPAFLYGTAKTHKFQNPGQITMNNLKLRPIVST